MNKIQLLLSFTLINQNLLNILDRILISDKVNHITLLYESSFTDLATAILLSTQYSKHKKWSIMKFNKYILHEEKNMNLITNQSLCNLNEYSLVISLCKPENHLLQTIDYLCVHKLIPEFTKHVILLNTLNKTNILTELKNNFIEKRMMRNYTIACIRWQTFIEIITYRLFPFQLHITDSRSEKFMQSNIYDQLFVDNSQNLNGHQLNFIVPMSDPPEVMLMTTTFKNSKLTQTFGGNDPFYAPFVEKFFNATVIFYSFYRPREKTGPLDRLSYMDQIVHKKFLVFENLTINVTYDKGYRFSVVYFYFFFVVLDSQMGYYYGIFQR